MAIYTYVVNHGDDSPRICAGTIINGGRLEVVAFDDLSKRMEELEYALDDIWMCANSGYNLEDLKAKIAMYCESPSANANKSG